MDGVVLVVRCHRTDREITREAVARLRFMQANVIGVVLNGLNLQQRLPELPYYFAAEQTRDDSAEWTPEVAGARPWIAVGVIALGAGAMACLASPALAWRRWRPRCALLVMAPELGLLTLVAALPYDALAALDESGMLTLTRVLGSPCSAAGWCMSSPIPRAGWAAVPAACCWPTSPSPPSASAGRRTPPSR